MVCKSSVIRILALALILFGAGTTQAQDALRDTFFKEADAALAAAEAADARLLAPKSYEAGLKDYESAEIGLQRGRNIEHVRSKAAEAEKHLRTAAESAELARTVLAQVLKSRQDAANVKAPALSPDIWEKAQREFAAAVRALERGDIKRAKKQDIEATSLYRDAELVAIKATYLTDTRRLLADADRARVGRYAPVTLAKAKELLAEAEQLLTENRYDADQPRILAQHANYEAKHALYLSKVIRDIRDKDLTIEQLILQWEAPLAEIAGAADILPLMADGHTELTKELVAYVDNMRADNQSLDQQLSSNDLRLADMEEEIRALDQRLGGATAERAALVQRLEAEARIKEQFERVEQMFSRDEARVFREGNNVILRLTGLSFDSGKWELRQDSFDLLAKIEQAIDVFPRSDLVIEGHTDSYGSDDSNHVLSQRRAESVQQYMVNAMRIPSYRLIATGYGETNPVANNETESGRARNRRIDIVIKPDFNTTSQARN